MVLPDYHESWRKHPGIIQGPAAIRRLFPGFGYAVLIVGTYTALEWFYLHANPPTHASHAEVDIAGPRYGGAYQPTEPKPKHAVPGASPSGHH